MSSSFFWVPVIIVALGLIASFSIDLWRNWKQNREYWQTEVGPKKPKPARRGRSDSHKH